MAYPRRSLLEHFTGQDRKFEAAIVATSHAIDKAARVMTVELISDNADGALKIGLLAKLVFADADDAESLAVPESAVVYESGATRVFVVTTEKNSRGVSTALQPRAIHVGRSRNGMVEVLDGLQTGENVEATDALFIDGAARGY